MGIRAICAATLFLAGLPLAGTTQTTSSRADTAVAGSYLRAGDAIRLRVWREPDLSGEFPVDRNGTVVFPKIGAQQVTDVLPDELRARLVGEFQRYLRNTSIDVVFLRRINVLGSVRAPGLYAVDPTMMVADVLALAGGVTPDGRQDRVQLVRGDELMTADITQRTRIADLPIHSGDQLYVPERSWISRNSAVVASAGVSVLSLLITIAVAR